MTRSDRPALILVDIQKGFGDIDYWGGQRNNPNAERRSGELLGLWRARGLPICHIQHCSTILVSPLHVSNAGNAFQDIVVPQAGELIFRKKVNSAFIGTDLQAYLVRAGIRKLIIAGLTTDHCISTTARMAGNLGFETKGGSPAGQSASNFGKGAKKLFQAVKIEYHRVVSSVFHSRRE